MNMDWFWLWPLPLTIGWVFFSSFIVILVITSLPGQSFRYAFSFNINSVSICKSEKPYRIYFYIMRDESLISVQIDTRHYLFEFCIVTWVILKIYLHFSFFFFFKPSIFIPFLLNMLSVLTWVCWLHCLYCIWITSLSFILILNVNIFAAFSS